MPACEEASVRCKCEVRMKIFDAVLVPRKNAVTIINSELCSTVISATVITCDENVPVHKLMQKFNENIFFYYPFSSMLNYNKKSIINEYVM